MPKRMSGNSNVKKAFIAKIVDDAIKSTYTFTMNFSELQRSSSAEYNLISPPGSMFPTAIYKSSPGGEISFSVMIDLSEIGVSEALTIYTGNKEGTDFALALDKPGIEAHLDFFESLTLPDALTFLDSRSRWTSPARLIFGVGDRTWNVVCTNVSQRETLFTRQLSAFRALVDVTLKPIFTGESDMLSYMEKILTNNNRVVS